MESLVQQERRPLTEELNSPELTVPTHEPSRHPFQSGRCTTIKKHYSRLTQDQVHDLDPRTFSSPIQSQLGRIPEESTHDDYHNQGSLEDTSTALSGASRIKSRPTPAAASEKAGLITGPVPQSASDGWKKSWSLFSTNPFAHLRMPRLSKFSDLSRHSTYGTRVTSESSPRRSEVELLTSEQYSSTARSIPLQTLSPTTLSSIDSNSTVTTSSTVVPASFSSSRTSIEVDSITLPISSPDMYCWYDEKVLYIGKLRVIPPPSQMENEWLECIRIRLLGDIRLVLQSLPHSLPREKTIVEPELCMAGEVDEATGSVELRPTILIRCGGRKCKRAVAKAVEDLGYLQTFSKGRIRVRHKAPKFASSLSTDSYISDPTTEIATGAAKLHAFVKHTESACGLRVKFRVQSHDSDQQRICKLGGLVKIDNKVYGLTTAHAIFELLGDDTSEETDSDTDSELDDGFFSDSPTLGSHSGRYEDDQPSKNGTSGEVGTSKLPEDILDPTEWSLATLGPYSYASDKHLSRGNNAYGVSSGSDFALIEAIGDQDQLSNYYASSRYLNSQIYEVCTIDKVTTDTIGGAASVICSPTDVQPGYLLQGDAFFLDRSTIFSTKKIQTEKPLERGFSGTWVVRGSQLLGMIIAVYEDEPYVHILPIGSVFSDIRAHLSDGSHVPQVYLPEDNDQQQFRTHLSQDMNEFPQEEQGVLMYRRIAQDSPSSSLSGTLVGSKASTQPTDDEIKMNLWSCRNKHSTVAKADETHDFEKGSYRIESLDRYHVRQRSMLQMAWIAVQLIIFCIHLDRAMFPFIITRITDDLHSLEDIGLYTSLNSLFHFLCLILFEYLYTLYSGHKIFLPALLILQLGWLTSGLSYNSKIMGIGRSLSGIGAAGVLVGAKFLRTHTNEKNYSLYRHLRNAAWCIALILGPFLAGVLTDSFTWRYCFYFNLYFTSVLPFFFVYPAKDSFLKFPRDTQQPYNWYRYSLGRHHAILILAMTTVIVVALVGSHLSPRGALTSSAISLMYVVIGFCAWVIKNRPWEHSSWFPRKLLVLVADITCNANLTISTFYIPVWLQVVQNSTILLSALISLATTVPFIIRSMVFGYFGEHIVGVPNEFCSWTLVTISALMLWSLEFSSQPWRWITFQIIFGLGAGIARPGNRVLGDFGVYNPLKELTEATVAATAHTLFMAILRYGLSRVDSLEGFILDGGLTDWKMLASGDEHAAILAAFDKGLTGTFLTPSIVIFSLLFIACVCLYFFAFIRRLIERRPWIRYGRPQAMQMDEARRLLRDV